MNTLPANSILAVLIILISISLVGCRTMSADDAVSSGLTLLQAASITDAQMMQEAKAAAAAYDQNNKLAPANSKYQKRIGKLTANLKT